MDALITGAHVVLGIASVFALMAAPLWALLLLADRRQKNRIRQHFGHLGIAIERIEAFPNHYGVHFIHDGTTHYVRCVPESGRIRWIREVPDFIVGPNDYRRSG